MVSNFYDKPSEGLTDSLLDYKWSPAEVNQILFRNFDTPSDAIKELVELQPKDLYGFESVENISYEEFAKSRPLQDE